MTTSNTIGRRALLKLGGTAIVGGSVGAAANAHGQSGQADAPGTIVHHAELVPPGAQARVAFVTDHHYWPRHLENWGGGAQITSSSDRRMPDLAAALNAERPDVSIHGGDVISAGGAFFPTPSEYDAQLAFAADFYSRLTHPSVAMVGNHETLDPYYASHDQLAAWQRHFGAPYREHDVAGWRILTINAMLPNAGHRYGKGDSYGNAYGIDEEQVAWLRDRLTDAASRNRKALLVTHVPPRDWVNAHVLEAVLGAHPHVKAVVCGHWHRNSLSLLAGVPVLVRASNVEAPFGYHMLHLYADGRVVVVQRSQHFPYEEYLSTGFQGGMKQGAEADRYLTLGGSSALGVNGLRVFGDEPAAAVVDGHLRLSSRQGRAGLLVDTAALGNARLSLTIVKAGAELAGGVALADAQGRGGVEAVITSRYSPAGKVYLQRLSGDTREILDRSWFNVADHLAYRLVLESRNGHVTASWKNMLTLQTSRPAGVGTGHFGCFVERGTALVTDIGLEALPSSSA